MKKKGLLFIILQIFSIILATHVAAAEPFATCEYEVQYTSDSYMKFKIVINDENDTLYLYDVKTKGVSISGSNLIIDSDFDSGEIVLEKPKYTSDNFLLYTSGSSQKMMTVGDINTPTSKVKVNLISGSVSINKLDNDTESDLPIGEASLKGSIYGLYNNDNVLVDKFIIGEKEMISHLPIGHYYVKEIKPGNGYLLDDNAYDVDITKDNLNISLTVYDEVIRRKVDLFKVYGTNETGIMTGEEGIKFIVYDKDNVLYDTIVTDSDGYASIILPYGTYTFHQDNSTPGYYKVDDFKVTIDTFDSRPIYKLLSDSEITSKIKIIKKDIDTLDNVVNSNIKFKIFDVQNDSYVSFKLTYPEVKVIDEFELNTDGIFVTPDTLPAGEYILYEVDDYMEGYKYNSDGIRFTIDDSSDFINDDDYEYLQKFSCQSPASTLLSLPELHGFSEA